MTSKRISLKKRKGQRAAPKTHATKPGRNKNRGPADAPNPKKTKWGRRRGKKYPRVPAILQMKEKKRQYCILLGPLTFQEKKQEQPSELRKEGKRGNTNH